MPKPPRRPPELVGKIFRRRTVLAKGLLTPADLRSKAWKQLFHGVYSDAELTFTHAERCALFAHYVLRQRGVIAGRSAVLLHTEPQSRDVERPIEVIVPRKSQVRRGNAIVHLGDVPADDVCVRDGIRVTTPARTCWDLAQWLDIVEAVVLVDVFVARRLVDTAQLLEMARSQTGSRGWRKLVRVAELVDGGSQSHPESRLRVRLVLAGVPQPVTQYVVMHDGRFVARTDLAWPDQKVAVEYDGLWHVGSARQMSADVSGSTG
jgi:hypothetical protein